MDKFFRNEMKSSPRTCLYCIFDKSENHVYPMYFCGNIFGNLDFILKPLCQPSFTPPSSVDVRFRMQKGIGLLKRSLCF